MFSLFELELLGLAEQEMKKNITSRGTRRGILPVQESRLSLCHSHCLLFIKSTRWGELMTIPVGRRGVCVLRHAAAYKRILAGAGIKLI